ncbi:MAG TPA: sulfur carrier protein ThiS [Candidatus Acidoferrales bacterium]|nr:sulfur carrier protein ThiS [Candidatus Acidoferrales bacterium]
MSEPEATAITLNGELFPISGDLALTTLLDRLGMRPGRVAVELNREIVPRADYPRTVIRVGDHLEIINFVGGG